MNNSFKMNAYNFRPVDKNNTPIVDNITKQLKTGPNVLRMFFSSTDNINTTLDANSNVVKVNNQPIYRVDPTVFTKFDANRPVYYFLEFLLNTSATSPQHVYNLVWLNMPSSNATSYTNNTYKNIIGTFRTTGSIYNRLMPYVCDINQLTSISLFQFAFVQWDHTLVTDATLANNIFAITFYQD